MSASAERAAVMRVSFDIDDTLVLRGPSPDDELAPRGLRWLFAERLRPGSVGLLRTLRSRGCDPWIYTTSYRSVPYLRGWFLSLGIRIAGVVNQARHDRVVGRRGPSKWPPAFAIDLHVDDSVVADESAIAGRFELVVVDPSDPGWSQQVLAAVDARAALTSGASRGVA